MPLNYENLSSYFQLRYLNNGRIAVTAVTPKMELITIWRPVKTEKGIYSFSDRANHQYFILLWELRQAC